MKNVNYLVKSVFLLTVANSIIVENVFAEKILVATQPYPVQLADSQIMVDLGGKSRTFDFGGDVPFVNPTTGLSDIATFNVFNPSTKTEVVLNSYKIKNEGMPGRIFKQGGYTSIGYAAGDGVVQGKLRSQINTFQLSSRKRYLWDMTFRLAGSTLNSPYPLTPVGLSPAALWQIKAPDLPPTLVMAVDTDPKDSTSLQLIFDSRLDPNKGGVRVADISGIKPMTDINVTVETFLDERTPEQGGQGFLKITVNGTLLFSKVQQTAQTVATLPYQGSFMMYLHNNTTPLPFSKFSHWKKARVIVD